MSVPVSAPSPSSDPWNHASDPKCEDRRVAVVVDGTEIPTNYVETTVTQDGVLDVQRLTEVHFPAEWYGQSVVDHISQFDATSQSAYSKAEIYWQEPKSGQWFLEHVGWVRGVGGSQRADGMMKAWVDSPANLLTGIPFSGRYRRPSIRDVLSDVVDAFTKATVFTDVTVGGGSSTVSQPTTGGVGAVALFKLFMGQGLPAVLGPLPDQLSNTVKVFKSNRHTLADVITWLTETMGGRVYFEPAEGGGLGLIYEPKPRQWTFAASQLIEDGVVGDAIGTHIIENDALEEIQPINAITVYGSSKVSILGHNISQLESGEFPVATVVSPKHIERVGQVLQPPIIESEATTIDDAESVAKTKLKKAMTTEGQGDLLTYARPAIAPMDRLTAVPVCREMVPSGSVPPVDYEVEKITHTKEAGKEAKSRISVSAFVDYADFETTTKEMRDARGDSDTSDNDGEGVIPDRVP